MAQYVRLLIIAALLAGTSACSTSSETEAVDTSPGVSTCVSAEEDDGTAACVNSAPEESVGSDSGMQDAVADALVE